MKLKQIYEKALNSMNDKALGWEPIILNLFVRLFVTPDILLNTHGFRTLLPLLPR